MHKQRLRGAPGIDRAIALLTTGNFAAEYTCDSNSSGSPGWGGDGFL